MTTDEQGALMQEEFLIELLRGVGNVQLRFRNDRQVWALFGPNGVGKTKCLEAIFFAWLIPNRIWQEVAGQTALPFESVVMKSIDIVGPDRPMSLPGIRANDSVEYTTFDYMARRSGVQLDEIPIVFLGAQSRSAVISSKKGAGLIGAFAERRKAYLQHVLAAIANKQMTRLGMDEDVQGWFIARAQSDNPYQKTTDNRRVEIDTVMEILAEIDTRIERESLQIDGSGRVSFRIDRQLRTLQELSSGYISLVKIVQAIVAGYAAFTNELNLRHVRGVVLIDELESHLHAAWQANLIPKLKRLFPNTRFIVATHSPLVLAQLEDGEAYVLRRDQTGYVRSEEIESPNRRAFIDVLESGFGIDLNALKRESLLRADQTEAKAALLALLKEQK